jgi:uncharacterized protein with ATP-grasp and redox domains
LDWWPECMPCVMRMTLSVARQVLDDDDDAVMAVLQEVAGSQAFSGEWLSDKGRRPRAPEVVRDVWVRLLEMTGVEDPLRSEKERQNATVMAALPELRAHVETHPDPFLAAVRLAIAGNALDAMVLTGGDAAAGPDTAAAIVGRAEAAPIDLEQVEGLRSRLAVARRVAYLGDNCGEVVLDRLLIETVLGTHGERPGTGDIAVTFVTRTLPVVNDATVAEAETVGIGDVARIVPNGIAEPLPATALDRCSAEALRVIEEADLVISKGGANFEMLDDEESLAGKVSFLLHGKCVPLCGALEAEPGELIVSNR